MKAGKCIVVFGVVFFGFLPFGRPQSASSSASVQVTETISASNATYNYVIVNSSGSAVTRLSIGYDSVHKAAELLTFPVGWTLSGGLTPAGVSSPPGWMATLISQEESPFFWIQWGSSQLSGNVEAGQTLSGFTIILPKADVRYKTGYYDLLLSDLTHVSGVLGFTIPGDLNGDGKVNCVDLAIVNASFGRRARDPEFDPVADVNRDGIVDIRDLAFVSRYLPAGTKCP